MTGIVRGGIPEVRGRRALVYSLGMEGRDLAAWLVANGATVVMSDTRSDELLRAAGAVAPAGVERVVTGQPLLDPAGFDLLAISQSLLRHDPAVARARELGIPVVSQLQLFLRLCPGRVIGITGSSGKSTTTALVAAMAAEAGVEHVVGGNIGEALLGRLEEIRAETTVVLEISHTQLQYIERGPDIAAITNITPNHLDQFSWDAYVGLKRRILELQCTESVAVLNADDDESREMAGDVRGELRWAAMSGRERNGAWVEGGTVYVGGAATAASVLPVSEVRMRGAHNVANVVMACAIANAAGWPASAMAAAARTFAGVQHRLEVVGRAGGVTWVNDSIATSPERTMAGLAAFAEPVVLLLGGRDKNLPLEGLRARVAERCRAVVTFGEAAQLFDDGVAAAAPVHERVDTLDEAVAAAARLAQAGDVVLLSPAGTSFDAYPNFEARGVAFRALVRQLPGFTQEVR
ncbi:MAG: UDP-N-acetylmuramoyl-L-alanine--D-glutamate ligase [Dehalococcoidia bacterium]|nr:UDP-N-acetylmuramoyl-L-alanine--D-glutamate ligase [Dehalococcoidia bacterium]